MSEFHRLVHDPRFLALRVVRRRQSRLGHPLPLAAQEGLKKLSLQKQTEVFSEGSKRGPRPRFSPSEFPFHADWCRFLYWLPLPVGSLSLR
jgi:hypothetical protein